MFKKKEDNPLKGLHGQELIDAINKPAYRVATKEEMIAAQHRIDELNRKYARQEEIKNKIGYFLKPIFFHATRVLFHFITFISRLAGAVSCIAMLYGLYCGYKAFTAWRAGETFTANVKTAVILIALPFIAYGIAEISERIWHYFEDNKY